MRYTALATRISNHARIIVPLRRNVRNAPLNCKSFTEKANVRSREAAKAASLRRKLTDK
jgi:hypothetical protein